MSQSNSQVQLRVYPLLTVCLPSRAYKATELELGELVKDPHFTLFESVGALEVSNICSRLYLWSKLKVADYGQ